ncbi:MAG: peptide chain release factor N(5)-glutamine methyltransferase [Candidatus Doudnabacteria bacterium]|nr:peptide chain release factor N(5)-glutamine methyltransferase [bacterium]MDZ4243788.1 peptide chain release factor N(5)-glutamine methyltransferase [Candidatus Doudnabacteria bacterium]
MTVADAFKLYPKIETELLLEHVLKKSKEYLLTRPEYRLNNVQTKKLHELAKRRNRGEPIAYLLGFKYFYGLKFGADRHVLIPRPETELLVELALEGIKNGECRIENVVDVGTGSGNIIVSIAKRLARYGRLVYHTPRLYGIDSSNKALAVARENAEFHGVSKKIEFRKGNLIENLKLKIENCLLTANLPYLTPAQYRSNPDLRFEPKQALVGGKDGLKHYRELFKQISKFHIRNSIFLFELDPSQRTKLKSLAKKYLDNCKIEFYKDLAGRDRVCQITTMC